MNWRFILISFPKWYLVPIFISIFGAFIVPKNPIELPPQGLGSYPTWKGRDNFTPYSWIFPQYMRILHIPSKLKLGGYLAPRGDLAPSKDGQPRGSECPVRAGLRSWPWGIPRVIGLQ